MIIILSKKNIDRIEFAPITIFCGSNGSGKTTVLNTIAKCADCTVCRLYDPFECLSDEHKKYDKENIVLETDEHNREAVPDSSIILNNVNMFFDYEFSDSEMSGSEWVFANMCDFSEYKLCFLDSPEALLPIDNQKELVKRIEMDSYLNGTQFIISTSSPVIAAAKEAMLYDLDITPVRTRRWRDLSIVRAYYGFFDEINIADLHCGI